MTAAKLLVVEDEPRVAAMVEYLLDEEGFRVDLMPDGARALDALARDGGYHALITDVRLGEGPDGWAVARAARARAPDLPVLYMTADSAADWATHGVPDSHLLEKPFTAQRMLTTVDALLADGD